MLFRGCPVVVPRSSQCPSRQTPCFRRQCSHVVASVSAVPPWPPTRECGCSAVVPCLVPCGCSAVVRCLWVYGWRETISSTSLHYLVVHVETVRSVCVYVLTQCLREKFNGKSYMYKNTYVNTIVDKYTCADVAAEPALDVFFCALVQHIMTMHWAWQLRGHVCILNIYMYECTYM